MSTAYYLRGLGQAQLALTAAGIVAPEIESLIAGSHSGDVTDPAGAQRQQNFQKEEAAMASKQQAPAQSLVAATAVANKSSTLTKWLIFGGVGMVVLGTVGLLLYRHMREE